MNPLAQKDAGLQKETFSPKIPTINIREPNITNQTTRRDKVGSIKNGGSTASGYDTGGDLSEENMHAKFVNTQSLGRDD